jgi:alkylmercury lyase
MAEHIHQGAQEFVVGMKENVGLLDLPMHVARLLAADGQPVSLERLAAAGGWRVEEVEAELRRDFWQGLDWDEQGRLAGLGLTLHPTPHTFHFDGKTFYTHCAGDALWLPTVVGGPAVVESRCPATGRSIRVELTPTEVTRVDPPEAVMSTYTPEGTVTDVVAQVCANRNLFASAEAAGGWLAAYPQGQVIPIADVFEIQRLASVELGYTAPAAGRPHCC